MFTKRVWQICFQEAFYCKIVFFSQLIKGNKNFLNFLIKFYFFRVTFKNGVKPALKAIKADNTFMCSFCDKVFKFQFSLNLHLNRTHSQISKNKINWTPNVILSKDVKEPFKCDECDNIFVTHDKLLAHVALVHNGDHSTQTTQYKCHECDALFVTHKRLLTHVAKIHYSDRVMAFFGKNNRECVICNQVAISKSKFRTT